MREWLTVIIVLLILGILLDGMRRMRAHRRDHLRMKRRVVARADKDGADEPGGSEFPSGGARVAAYRDPDHVVSVNKSVKESHTASRWTRGAPANRLPEQVSLKLDTPVPMLMDSVDENAQPALSPNQEREREPSIGNLANLDDDEMQSDSDYMQPDSDYMQPDSDYMRPDSDYMRPDNDYVTSDFGTLDTFDDEDSFDEPLPSRESNREPGRAPGPEVEASKPQPPPKKRDVEKPREPETVKAPDEVLIINVMARKGELFAGPDLLNALLSQGLRYGDMDIFHRHESSDGRGRILFSAANMVVPGTFDLAAMDSFSTPGISMFLSLPIATDSLSAYNLLASTAQAIAEALDGELKDENRSVMTRQTIEHGRQRVIEYERKRRLAKT